MDTAGVLLVGCGPTNDGAQLNDRGLIGDLLGCGDGIVESLDVFLVFSTGSPVYAGGIPTVGLVALKNILGEGNIGVIFNRDVVAVEDNNQVAQLLVTGQRGSLGGNALFNIALRSNGVDGVVEGEVPSGASGSKRPRIRR